MGVRPIPCARPSMAIACAHVSRQKKTRYPALDREVGHPWQSSVEGKMLPRFDYYLDESDPDIVALHRQDGTFVAAFSAQGATIVGILEAAGEDYQQSMESPGLREDGHQKRSA